MSSKPPKHPHKTAHTHKAASTSAPGQPVFAQPQPSPDPTGFKNPVTDQSDKELANVEAVPQPVGGAAEPILTLAQLYGSEGAAKTAAIEQAGQIVFHSVGDTGSAHGPSTQSLVADKMVSDFTEANSADIPSFFYHLGDIAYYFGEATYYYDQFYEPYRSYPAPIVAIPGNHDGVVYAADPAPTLAAFLANFCAPKRVNVYARERRRATGLVVDRMRDHRHRSTRGAHAQSATAAATASKVRADADRTGEAGAFSAAWVAGQK